MTRKSFSVRRSALVSLAVIALVLAACSNTGDIDATIDARVSTALAAVPSITPQPSATPFVAPSPLPTSTPAPSPTLVPTATPAPTTTPAPASVPPTLVPTATPQPTATPIIGLGATPTPITVPSDVYADVRLSVVRIISGNTFGSGWAIEEGWIITNEHVVNGASTVSIEVPLQDGGVRTVVGTVRGIDTKRDLAAIQVEHGAPVLPTRIVNIDQAGIPIVQLGYSVDSTGGFPVIHTGIITTVVRQLGNVLSESPKRIDRGNDTAGVAVVYFDADADPGDSGGPVLDMEGNVVGITFGATVLSSGGKRVQGQQQATGIESINRVWTPLKNGTNTTSL